MTKHGQSYGYYSIKSCTFQNELNRKDKKLIRTIIIIIPESVGYINLVCQYGHGWTIWWNEKKIMFINHELISLIIDFNHSCENKYDFFDRYVCYV